MEWRGLNCIGDKNAEVINMDTRTYIYIHRREGDRGDPSLWRY